MAKRLASTSFCRGWPLAVFGGRPEGARPGVPECGASLRCGDLPLPRLNTRPRATVHRLAAYARGADEPRLSERRANHIGNRAAGVIHGVHPHSPGNQIVGIDIHPLDLSSTPRPFLRNRVSIPLLNVIVNIRQKFVFKLARRVARHQSECLRRKAT
jgi:hypothetical protein